MGRVKTLFKILYLVVFIALGFLFAPNLLNKISFDKTYEIISNSLQGENYGDAVALVSGFYDNGTIKTYSLEDGAKLVLLPSVTPYQDEQGNNKVHKSYVGFLFNVWGKYETQAVDNNQTKVIVTDKDNVNHDYELLNGDSNKDGIKDYIVSLNYKDFLYVDIAIDYGSISKLTFIDQTGNQKYVISDMNLDYSEAMFTDSDAFVELYNENQKDEKLFTLKDELLAKNTNYKYSNMQFVQSEATKSLILIAILYFIILYIVYDFVLGTRLILRFIKWIIRKIRGKNPEEVKEKKKEVVSFGKSIIEISIKVPEKYSEVINIKFKNLDEEKQGIEFSFNQDNNYCVSLEVDCGTYNMPTIEVDDEHELKGLPKFIITSGEKISLTPKIIKKESRGE